MNWTHDFLDSLFAHIKAHEIDAVLMRSKDWLRGLPAGDIDILVERKNAKKLDSALKEYAETNNWKIVLRDRDANHIHYVLVKVLESEILSAHLDIQTSLGRKGFLYSNLDQVIREGIPHGSIHVQDGLSEGYCLLLHVILDKLHAKDSYREMLSRIDIARLEVYLNDAVGKSIGHALTQWLESGMPDKEIPELNRRLRHYLRLRFPQNFIFPYLHRLKRVSRYFGPRDGVLIAALGPDGAGKSTLLDGIENKLEIDGLPVKVVYMGKRETFLPTSRLIRRIYENKGNESMNRHPEKHETASKKGSKKARILDHLKEIVGLTNWFFEQWARYLVKIRPTTQQGGVVLCDRYFYDLADRPENSIVHSGAFRYLMKHLFPRPDLLYFIWESPEILYQRKKENSIERNKELIDNYRAMLSVMPNYRELKTDTDADALCQEVARTIVNKMAAE